MCEMFASREKLAAVSKERDQLRKLNDALAQKCDALEELRDVLVEKCDVLEALKDALQDELDGLTNPGPEEAPTRSDILDLAKRCVCGDREQDYGSPEQNFERIAEMWEAYLIGKCTSADVCIQPEDVAAMLALLKIARIASGHAKADNWVDLAGYAACGGEIEGENTDMSDLISRSAFADLMCSACNDYFPDEPCEPSECDLCTALANAPAVDAVPVVHGRWIGTEYDGYADGCPVYDLWECSECRDEYESEGDPPPYNYCPNCGTKMDLTD